MKKLLVVALLLVSFLTLSACSNDTSDIKIMNDAFDKVTIANASNVTSNLTLASKVDVKDDKDVNHEVKVTWQSSNKYLVSDAGVVKRPDKQNENVIMKATLTYKELSNDKSIIITIKKAEVVVPTETLTISEILQQSIGKKVNLVDVGVVVLHTNGFYVSDNTNYIFVYTKDAPTVSVGDKVSITNGEYDRYFEAPQLKGGSVEKTGEFGSFTNTHIEKTVAEIAALDQTQLSTYTSYTITGTLEKDGNKYSVKDSTKSITILNGLTYSSVLDGFNGKTVKINVVYNNYHSTEHIHRVLFLGASTDIVEVM